MHVFGLNFSRTVPSKKSPADGTSARPGRGRPLSKGYDLGQVDRFSEDFFSGSLSADQAVFGGIAVARNRARWLSRNHNLTRKFLIMARSNVIGSKGIRMQSQAADIIKGERKDNKFDQQLIEEAYIDFSKARNFSLDTRMGRRAFAQVAFQCVLVDGECIVRKVRGADNPYAMAFQLIDAELLDHQLNRTAGSGRTEIRMGVELDANEKPLAYYFLEAAPATWAGSASLGIKHKRIVAAEIEHIFIAERPGQTRGFTHLMATGHRAKMIDSIEKAVTIGYRVAASKMGFFKPTEDYTPPTDKNGEPVDNFGDVPSDCAPGEFWELPEGLDFEAFDPGYPGASYDEFTKSITRSMAAGLGVSYPELGNDFEGVSYSAGQIGVHSDVALWSDFQQFWVDRFEEPVFRDWILMAITAGALQLPIKKLAKFQRAKFQPPRRKPIDAMKTHKAQSIALGDMSRDPFDIAAENGSDFEDVVKNFARAKALLEKEGLPIPQSWGAFVELTEAESTALVTDE